MVAVPTHQGSVAGVFKEKFQRRRFDVAVAKDCSGLAGTGGKAPEGWSTPRRFALTMPVDFRASVLECGGPPPLWPYGDNFARCGRWSRFQRAKAASLVSSKRNFSVGDSTWPSQKTTLALPWWREIAVEVSKKPVNESCRQSMDCPLKIWSPFP